MWFFKKKKPEPFGINFELIDNNDFRITSNWKAPESDEEANSLIRAFSNLLVYIQTGQISKIIGEAIAKTGNDKHTIEIAKKINQIVTQHVGDYHFSINKTKNTRKVTMTPEDVFNPKRYD